MCGIFGYFDLNGPEIFYDLGKYSETRGKEASGYMSFEKNTHTVRKFALPFSNNQVKLNILENQNQNKTYIGHTRLKTHGDEKQDKNHDNHLRSF